MAAEMEVPMMAAAAAPPSQVTISEYAYRDYVMSQQQSSSRCCSGRGCEDWQGGRNYTLISILVALAISVAVLVSIIIWLALRDCTVSGGGAPTAGVTASIQPGVQIVPHAG